MPARVAVPEGLAAICRSRPERAAWLDRLPATLEALRRRWSLVLGPPFETGSCAWVAPARTREGAEVVLKVGLPHFEGAQEIAGLRFWAGWPTVRLLDADEGENAMVLERCVPGTTLRVLAEDEQDVVIAGLLHELWRRPEPPHPFRPLLAMTRHWIESSRVDEDRWPDPGLTRAGLDLLEALARPRHDDVLLATDLHAGNVLAAARQPWLVIDPKPFVGDRAYDATQHLFNCAARLDADPLGTVRRVAARLGVDAERVRLWTFARLVAEPRDDWRTPNDTARTLAP